MFISDIHNVVEGALLFFVANFNSKIKLRKTINTMSKIVELKLQEILGSPWLIEADGRKRRTLFPFSKLEPKVSQWFQLKMKSIIIEKTAYLTNSKERLMLLGIFGI